MHISARKNDKTGANDEFTPVSCYKNNLFSCSFHIFTLSLQHLF